jgi:hypothetical protein
LVAFDWLEEKMFSWLKLNPALTASISQLWRAYGQVAFELALRRLAEEVWSDVYRYRLTVKVAFAISQHRWRALETLASSVARSGRHLDLASVQVCIDCAN